MNSSRSVLGVAITLATVAVVAGVVLAVRGTAVQMFMPHAHCYLFNRGLMWLHGGSDLLIGLAYVAISSTLVYVVYRARRDLPFHWMMLAFALFIVACGATHFMEVWTLQTAHPPYWLAGWVKLLTATASVTTAVLLPPLVPQMFGLLRSARVAAARKDELEKACAELQALHKKASPEGSSGGIPPNGESHDLAQMAKEVSVHALELEKAKEAAEAANRAKDQFLAVLSHELRTPLTPALAAASGLEHATNINPVELSEALGTIRRNIELEARLVDDLLDITRIARGKLEIHSSTIDLHETIRHATEMCRSEANQKGNTVNVSLKAEKHYVRGDGARLAQIFWNLMLNAVKFTPAQGNVLIRTLNTEDGGIRIEVSDNGIGIEADMLAQIFEPFQQGEATTTRRYGGLGLGLSVARGLVNAHGGRISAHSNGKNQGAVFAIDLPTIEPPAALGIGKATAPAPSPVRLRILLAEDHADTRHALERLLTRWGHEVRTAPTLAQAVETFAGFEADLLLSDIGLPDGTGVELLGRLREMREIRAIAMSGYGMEADLEMTRHAGFREHLVKPISAERLKEALARFASDPPSSSSS